MRVVRRIAIGLGAVVALIVVAGVAGLLVLGRMNLAGFVAGRASTALGRVVTVQDARLRPGRWLAVELTGVTIANAEGGSAPVMIEVRHVSAEVNAWSVLHGPAVIRNGEIEGLRVLLEHGAGGVPNWRFTSSGADGTTAEAKRDGGGKRLGMWSLRDVAGRDLVVTYRTSSGVPLVTKAESLSVWSDGDDRPLRVTAEGTYQQTPLALEAEVPSTEVYRRPLAVPTVLRLRSGDVKLVFDGTMEQPLALDGAAGRLTLDAPILTPIVAMIGGAGTSELSLQLDGSILHSGGLWWLREARGALEGQNLTLGALRVIEGKPDLVSVAAAFVRMDLNELLGAGERGKRGGADMSLAVDRNPGTLIDARVTAGRLSFDALDAAEVVLVAKQEPGRVAVDELTMEAFGTQVRAKGAVAASGTGWGRVTAEVELPGADVQTLRRTMGFGPVPLTGRLVGRFTAEAAAPTLNGAVRSAKVDGVVSMRGGAISKSVVEQASIDVRSLLRRAEGMSAVTCLVAGLTMQGGVGRVAPMRVRAADGVIEGSATFDLNRRVFDLTVASESSTTGAFALDVPVRVSGPFASPSVGPAQLSAAGRAELAAADDTSRLPAGLREMARRYACPASGR